jgi:hypothetical protein
VQLRNDYVGCGQDVSSPETVSTPIRLGAPSPVTRARAAGAIVPSAGGTGRSDGA